MTDDLLKTLLPAIDIAAFERRTDGTFSSIAPHPAWFSRLIGDVTFPFLGHVLEEAVAFWDSGTAARREWGPCEEVDDAGRPFHYKIIALTAGARQYLLFQLDRESDRMRDVLQKVRQDALVNGYQSRAETDTLRAFQAEVRRATGEMDDLLRQLLTASSRDAQLEATKTLVEKCRQLANAVDTTAGAVRPPAKN